MHAFWPSVLSGSPGRFGGASWGLTVAVFPKESIQYFRLHLTSTWNVVWNQSLVCPDTELSETHKVMPKRSHPIFWSHSAWTRDSTKLLLIVQAYDTAGKHRPVKPRQAAGCTSVWNDMTQTLPSEVWVFWVINGLHPKNVIWASHVRCEDVGCGTPEVNIVALCTWMICCV